MKAIQNLKEEHEHIDKMLNVLRKICFLLQADKGLDVEHIDRVLDFFKVYVGEYHNGKEEEILYPYLEKHGLPMHAGPLAVLLEENELGREYLEAMCRSLAEIKNDTLELSSTFVIVANKYLALIKNHNEKENEMLFDMADRVLSDTEQEGIFDAFKKHEKEMMGEETQKAYINSIIELEGILMFRDIFWEEFF